MKFEIEQMNESFVKHHIRGLAVDAVIHRFTAADTGEYAHDHPFRFTSFIISGGYVEKRYRLDETRSCKHTLELIERLPGTSHIVEADRIHQIVELLGDTCETIILPERKVKEPCFWRFDETGIYKRVWNEKEFVKYER